MSGFYGPKDRWSKRSQRMLARINGRCPTCCAREPQEGYVSCEVCLNRSRDRNRLVSELVREYRQQGGGQGQNVSGTTLAGRAL